MKKLKVSIIINNYNYGRFLAESIESCLRQNYNGTETIVIDDGSTDDSRNIILRYAQKIKPVFKENGGQASCFNAGLNICSGDIVIFLDADDYLADHCVHEVVQIFRDNPGLIKVHWPLVQVNSNGSPTGKIVPTKKLIEGNLRQQVILKGPAHAGGPPHSPPTSGNAWSKALLEQIFPIPESAFRYGADDYLFVLAPLLGEIKSIQQPLGYYRVHGENDTLKSDYIHSFAARFENCCNVLGEFLDKEGVSVDASSWPRDHWYHQVWEDMNVLINTIPEHEPFILIDDDHWQAGNALMGRRRLHLTGQNDHYWGPPANDQDAIHELERNRTDKKANYVVFTWPSFWWLDHYKHFREHLDIHYPRLLSNDRLIIYQLNDKNGHGE